MIRSRTVVLSLGLSTLVMAACGDSSSSISGPSVRGLSGSTISGQINSGSAQTTAGTATTAGSTGAGMTVAAEGTGKSTTADSAGRFMLTGLPEGRVQLRFTGSGADARLPISVGRGEVVNIAVRVDGNRATLESEQHVAFDEDDDDHDEGDIEGIVSGLTGTCPNLTFTVNAITVKTNSSTKFEGFPCSQMERGRKVEIEGGPPVNGVVTATRVEQYY